LVDNLLAMKSRLCKWRTTRGNLTLVLKVHWFLNVL